VKVASRVQRLCSATASAARDHHAAADMDRDAGL
jgi:hypothetical protein